MNLLAKSARKLARCLALLFRAEFFLLAAELSAGLVPRRTAALSRMILFKLDREKISPREPLKGLDIAPGDEETVRELVRDLYADKPSTREFYLAMYENGGRPWVARAGGRVVGVVWLFTGDYVLPWEGDGGGRLDLRAEPDARFVANVLVDPDRRGRGIFPRIATACFQAFPDSVFYSCIESRNAASIKSHETTGFRPCGTADFVRIFRHTRCFVRVRGVRSRRFALPADLPVTVSLVPEKPCKPD